MVFGCGYVGTAVAVEALGRGAVVTALTRNVALAAELRSKGMETVVADLANRDWHGKIPPNPEFVLNCVSSGGGGLEAYRRSYVEGTRSILDWAKQGGTVGTLVYTSSTSVYPQGDGVRVDETAPTPSASASDRARLLLQAEDEIRGAGGVCRRWFVLRLAGDLWAGPYSSCRSSAEWGGGRNGGTPSQPRPPRRYRRSRYGVLCRPVGGGERCL